MGKATSQDNTVCRNRKATFRFEFLDQFECGIVLEGPEVKSLRDKAVSLEEAYARIVNDEVWLIGMHIAAYKHTSREVGEPTRRRKLLLHSHEVRKLRPKVEQKGLTLVPVRLYFNDRGIAKVTLALARGKTVGDKRQALKARDDQREMNRALRRKR